MINMYVEKSLVLNKIRKDLYNIHKKKINIVQQNRSHCAVD